MSDLPAYEPRESSAFSGTATPPDTQQSHADAWVLAATLALVPAAGMPTEWVLQDTLKSTLLAAGALIAAVVLLGSGLRRASLRNSVSWRWHGLLMLPAVLCLYAVGSMGWSHSYLGGVEACRWALLGLTFWVTLNVLQRTTVTPLLWGIHIGAVGASAWAAAQFWGGLSWFPQAAPPASTFANRNFFAEYLVCALPFSTYLLAQTSAPHRRQIMALSLSFTVVALMMTGTRSALVAMLLMAPILACALWRYRHALAWSRWSRGSRISVALVLVGGILGLGSVASSDPSILAEGHGATALQRSVLRASSMALPGEYTVGSFSIRASMWRSTARMLTEKPWTGVGAGAWEVHIPLYQGWNNSVETDFYAHNEFLQLLAEYGFPVGGGVLAILLAYLLMSAQNTWHMPVTGAMGQSAALRATALCSLLALLIVSNAGFPWRLASTGALMMVSLALLAQDTAVERRARQPALRLAMVLVLVASLFAAGAGVQAMRAESAIVRSIYALGQAQRSQASDPDASRRWHTEGLDALRTGLAINPHYRKLLSISGEQLAGLHDWENSAVVLERIAASRPYIPNVWGDLVLSYAAQGKAEPALHAWETLRHLQPDTPRTRALELLALSRIGLEAQAITKLNAYFDMGVVEYDMTQLAYSLGLRLHRWDLAERGLQLRARNWPETTADSYFRLGNMYVEAGKGFENQALAAFQRGWQAVPTAQSQNYRQHVPTPYREQL